MTAGYEWFSATRVTGLTAYAATSLACTTRWARSQKSDTMRRIFAWLAGVQLFLMLDMAFDWRWKLHNLVANEAAEWGVYGERRGPQVMVIGALFLALIAIVQWIFRRFRKRTAVAVAVSATMLSVGLWCCEAISLHYVDAVLYRMAGKVMIVSLIWVSLAAVACLGVWLDGRSNASKYPHR